MKKQYVHFVLLLVLLNLFIYGGVVVLNEDNSIDDIVPTLIPFSRSNTSPDIRNFSVVPDQPEILYQSVPNRAVLHLEPGLSDAELNAELAQIGGTVIERIDNLNVIVVNLPDPTLVQNIDNTLISSEPDYYVTMLEEVLPNDPLYSEQWALPMINAAEGWSANPAAVTVAVVDSGVCADHPDLQGRVLRGYDVVDDDNNPDDALGHGCTIAGAMAANMDNGIGIVGAAANVSILPVRVLDARGNGTYTDLASGIVYAVDHGAEIINLSLGGAQPSLLLINAIDYASKQGVTVIAAAGNTGSENILYPAAFPTVIAVGAVDSNGQTASFSARGAGIDLYAPGVSITTTDLNSDYSHESGTSIATAFVSAVAAMEKGNGTGLVVDGGIVRFNGTASPEPIPTEAPDSAAPVPEDTTSEEQPVTAQATLIVNTSSSEVTGDNLCSLPEAIDNANDPGYHDDCPGGDEGADVIVLNADVILDELNDTTNGENGLPSVTSEITIEGNGHAILRNGRLNGDVGQYTSIAITGSGNPIISYYDLNGELKLAFCNDQICTDPTIVLVDDSSTDVGKFNSLLLGTNDLPVISYSDETNNQLKLAVCESSLCSRKTISVVDSAVDISFGLSMALNTLGNPVIAYRTSGFDIKLAVCNDLTCTIPSSAFTDVEDAGAGSISLALDANDHPFISYFGSAGDYLGLLHCARPDCTDDDANELSVVTAIGSDEAGINSSLQLDANGNPVIGYLNLAGTNQLWIVHCNDPDCLGNDEDSALLDIGGYYVSLALDSNGNPIMAHTDLTNLKIAVCYDADCSTTTPTVDIVDTNDVGRFASLALDSNDNPFISYYDNDNGNLKLAICDNLPGPPSPTPDPEATEEPSPDVGCTLTVVDGDADTAQFRLFHVAETGNLTLNNVAMSGGRSLEGGAIYNLGTLRLENGSIMTNNFAVGSGGAIANVGGHVQVLQSTIAYNIANNLSGGINNRFGGILEILSSTLSENVATNDGGAIHMSSDNPETYVVNSTFAYNRSGGAGGGIHNYDGESIIVNSTFIGNVSNLGDAIRSSAGSTVEIKNSIFALGGETGENCFIDDNFVNWGNNFDTDGTCSATQVTEAALELGSLADNGGPTRTIALGGDSVAIDTITTLECTLPPMNSDLFVSIEEDQRGAPRPFGTGCDAGSFEFGATVPVDPDPDPGGNTVTATITAFDGGSNIGDLYFPGATVTLSGSPTIDYQVYKIADDPVNNIPTSFETYGSQLDFPSAAYPDDDTYKVYFRDAGDTQWQFVTFEIDSTPVTIHHIEVSQGIQDETNSVMLVEGKETYLRVYATCDLPTGVNCPRVGRDDAGVPAIPVRVRTGSDTLIDTYTINSVIPQSIAGTYDWKTQRDVIDPAADPPAYHSLHFILPPAWATGSGTAFTVNILGIEKSTSDLANSCCTFTTIPPISITYVPVTVGNQSTNPAAIVGSLTKNLYPFATETGITVTVAPLYDFNTYLTSAGVDTTDTAAIMNYINNNETKLNFQIETNHLGSDTSTYIVAWVPELQEVILDADGNSQTLVLANKGYAGTGMETVYITGSNGREQPTTNKNITGKTAWVQDFSVAADRWDTFSHEVGHLTGAHHPYNVCGETIINATWWPYSSDTTLEAGHYGIEYDGSHFVIKDDATQDYMTYCGDVWTSKWTYQEIAYDQPFPQSAYDNGYHLVTGSIHRDGTIDPDPIWTLDSTPWFENPYGTTYCVESLDAADTVLESQCFDVSFANLERDTLLDSAQFAMALHVYEETTRIILREGDTIHHVWVLSNADPVVQVDTPNGGDMWPATGLMPVSWHGSDPDGDTLTYRVFYSADGGASWDPISSATTANSVDVDVSYLAGGNNSLIRVYATDGIRTVSDDSDASFSVANHGPDATIIRPEQAISWPHNLSITLIGSGYDLENGMLDGSRLSWSSSLQGFLGTGGTLTVDLEAGTHAITLTVADLDGLTNSETVYVVVGDGASADTFPPVTTISLDGEAGNNGWYLSNVNVTISAQDDLYGSGVALIHWFRSSEGVWQSYVVPDPDPGNDTNNTDTGAGDPNTGGTDTGTGDPNTGDPNTDLPDVGLPDLGNGGGGGVVLGLSTDIVELGESHIVELEHTDEGEGFIQAYAIDRAGNQESPAVEAALNVDKTDPVIDISTPAAEITRVDLLAISVNAYDPMPGSGLFQVTATFDGQDIGDGSVLDLFWFDLGAYNFEATAEDIAGRTSSDSGSLTLVATVNSLIPTTVRLCNEGYIQVQGNCTAMRGHFIAAQNSIERGNTRAAINQLNAALHQLMAQRGKHISEAAYLLLEQDIFYVIESLGGVPLQPPGSQQHIVSIAPQSVSAQSNTGNPAGNNQNNPAANNQNTSQNNPAGNPPESNQPPVEQADGSNDPDPTQPPAEDNSGASTPEPTQPTVEQSDSGNNPEPTQPTVEQSGDDSSPEPTQPPSEDDNVASTPEPDQPPAEQNNDQPSEPAPPSATPAPTIADLEQIVLTCITQNGMQTALLNHIQNAQWDLFMDKAQNQISDNWVGASCVDTVSQMLELAHYFESQ